MEAVQALSEEHYPVRRETKGMESIGGRGFNLAEVPDVRCVVRSGEPTDPPQFEGFGWG